MDSPPTRPSSAAHRTRRAILDAAAATLSRDAAAPLADVARAAGVGRTTLHRHFPDRAALVRALALDAFAATEDALAQSRLDAGSATEALGRLVRELVALGDRFAFLLREPSLVIDPEVAAAEGRTAAAVAGLVERGRRSGELRADLPVAWVAEAAGALVYAAWLAVGQGAVARSEAGDAVLAILLDGVRLGRG